LKESIRSDTVDAIKIKRLGLENSIMSFRKSPIDIDV
jgi:hypothetical protein